MVVLLLCKSQMLSFIMQVNSENNTRTRREPCLTPVLCIKLTLCK